MFKYSFLTCRLNELSIKAYNRETKAVRRRCRFLIGFHNVKSDVLSVVVREVSVAWVSHIYVNGHWVCTLTYLSCSHKTPFSWRCAHTKTLGESVCTLLLLVYTVHSSLLCIGQSSLEKPGHQ